jgi:hypothetical protein
VDKSSATQNDNEKDALTYQISDEALEASAGRMDQRAGSFTLSFCSGLDTCPA